MIDPWFSFFRIAWVSWTFWLSLLACKKVCIIAFFLALFRIFHLSVKLYCTFVLPNFILGKTNKMCCFYLSSNICSFSTQNINFYIDFFLIRLSKISFAQFPVLVGLDGLEPSTSRLSGARSNHLSYRPFWTHLVSVRPSRRFPDWWRWRESNPWPPACRAGALPAELHPHIGFYISPWQLNNRCLYTAQYASNPVLRLWPWMSLRFFVFVLYFRTTIVPLYLCTVSITVSIERRWSSRTFRYGYLVTT